MSLRDVERAMIVFEYLYQMMGVFGPLMDEWARGRQRHIENEDDNLVTLSLFNVSFQGSSQRTVMRPESVPMGLNL